MTAPEARFIADGMLIRLLEIHPWRATFPVVSYGMLSRIAKLTVMLFGFLCLAHGRALACAFSEEAGSPPAQTFVTSERAVIIWDEAHQVEHFIRQASFHTQDPDLGFLVPTPQTPELAEADDRIFEMAAFLGQPKRIAPTNYRSPWTLVSPVVLNSFVRLDRLNPAVLLTGLSELKTSQEKPSVLAERDVGGYHATTLAAEDERMISAWLTTNGYLSTPELRAWLKPYIAAKWTITAFRLIKRGDSPVLVTRAVRLSFHTERPFYPYSEPSDRQQASAASPLGRALRVAILSNQRMTGALANNTPWPERLEFAGPSTPPPSASSWKTEQWLAFAKLDDPGHNTLLPTTLTTFIDESNPRPGTADLYFTPDQDQGSYQGDTVDFTLAPQDRLVFNHPLVDFAALLMLIILPAVPLYCGWTVLKQSPEEEVTPRKERLIRQGLLQPQIPIEQTPWMRTAHRLVGAIAIILGAYYGVQFVLLFLGEITSALFKWTDTSGNWIWIFIGLFLGAVSVVAMSWGVVYCGVNVWRERVIGVPLRPSNPFYVGGAWQGFMCVLSLLAGSVASLAVLGILVSLL